MELSIYFYKNDMRVIVALADKDFVDFLLSLMNLPLANVIDLLKGAEPFNGSTSIGKVYNSIEVLSKNGSLIVAQNLLLNPKCPTPDVLNILLGDERKKKSMFSSSPIKLPGLKSSVGYVKDIKYLVFDNLLIQKGDGLNSVFELFHEQKINSTKTMMKKVVVNQNKAREILRQSLLSKMVLSTVFKEELKMKEEVDLALSMRMEALDFIEKSPKKKEIRQGDQGQSSTKKGIEPEASSDSDPDSNEMEKKKNTGEGSQQM